MRNRQIENVLTKSHLRFFKIIFAFEFEKGTVFNIEASNDNNTFLFDSCGKIDLHEIRMREEYFVRFRFFFLSKRIKIYSKINRNQFLD